MDSPVVVQLQGQRGMTPTRKQDLPCTVFITPRSLKRHVFSAHQYSKNFTVKCGISGCAVITNKLRFLNKHLREEHNSADWTPDYATVYNIQTDGDDLNLQVVTRGQRSGLTNEQNIPASSSDGLDPKLDETECSIEPVYHQYSNPEHTMDDDHDDDEDDEISRFNEEVGKSNCERRKQICLSLARLRAQNTMTEVCFESVKDWTAGLLANLAHVMVGGMKKHLNREHMDRVDDVIELALGLSNPFHGLSEHSFLKVLHDDLGYVNPETVVLAEIPSSSGSERHTMQYIPMVGVLKMLLEDEKFVKQLHTDRSETGYLKDFCDGEYFKQHPMVKETPGSLQIQLYYDDFEVTNPLGTKICIHKIGALYYTFLNLDEQIRYSFENIFLLALFTVEDLKNPDIGWEKALHTFNEELHLLENGTHNSALIDGHPVTGTVTQLSADNLAADSLLGLDQKFSGDNVYVSAYCLCTGSDIQERTFIRGKRYFTLQTLNGRLASFDYNDQDSKNRPSSIKEAKLVDDTRNLKQYASQYWCLLRKLPLLVGDLVPEEDDHWCLLLCLIGIVDIILSPTIRTDVLSYLQTEICLFLREYKRLFPQLRVTPKMHYLLHYPRLIQEFGPLSRHWVMRYEGKHKLLKNTMDVTGNFINSAYTMAKRHQMQQVVSFHDRCAKNAIQVRGGFTVNVNELEHGQMLAQAGVPNQAIMADHIKVFGTVYRKRHVIWIGWDINDFEEFGEVLQILVYRDVMNLEKVHFVVECLQKLGFHEHFHSWEVCHTTPPIVKAIALIDLVDYNVVGKHHLFERGQEHRIFLNCKYRIDSLLEKV